MPHKRCHVPLLALGAAVTASGCSSGADADRFEPVANVQELMLHVVEPSAQHYWRSVGWILDENGEEYIHPENDDEWLAVENAAFSVAESGNLLMMEGRALDDGAWMAMAGALIDVGRRALEVAEARDEQGVFDTGAEMYDVCSACHAAYSPEILRPSDERFDEESGPSSPGGGSGAP
jgi:hypothetical protein